jgi:hypothetical protein
MRHFMMTNLTIAFFVHRAKEMSYNDTPRYGGRAIFGSYEARTETKLY